MASPIPYTIDATTDRLFPRRRTLVPSLHEFGPAANPVDVDVISDLVLPGKLLPSPPPREWVQKLSFKSHGHTTQQLGYSPHRAIKYSRHYWSSLLFNEASTLSPKAATPGGVK